MSDESADPELKRLEDVMARVEALASKAPPAPAEPDRSEQLNELAAALAKAQGKMDSASKDSSNPHFQSKYASLASCWEACREPLSANGLAVVQRVKQATGQVVVVETLLLHASGQWLKQDVRLPVDKPTAQSVGSAITYARRYGLTAMVGIAPDDDDDGNAASGKTAASAPPKGGTYVKPASKPDPRLTAEQNKDMQTLFRPGA